MKKFSRGDTARLLRDLMNLCHAAAMVGYAQPYAGGMTGRVQEVHSLLTMDILERAEALGMTEPQAWNHYHELLGIGGIGHFGIGVRQVLHILGTVYDGVPEVQIG